MKKVNISFLKKVNRVGTSMFNQYSKHNKLNIRLVNFITGKNKPRSFPH